ncbi:MAG: ATP-binding cassette domain-containing protein [bacterium]
MDNLKPVLLIDNLRINRDITILDGINWRIDEGQHWCILGANGSGKTSLLNALTAYLTFSSGKIEIFGHEYGTTDWRELRKKIGLISSSILQRIEGTETAIETVVSGKYAMINYWGEIADEDRQEAIKILKHMQCDHLAERPWRVLSQGERQRVCIARALMADLWLLLLDEPCAGLDPVARESFLLSMENAAQRKSSPAFVLVTHHVEEIMPSFTHVLIVKSGRVLASGEKNKVLTSTILSDAFGAKIKVRQTNSRYKITLCSRTKNR